MEHDLVIRNGVVIDGSGSPGYRADIGITGDRITKIGAIGSKGREEIDAEGHVVTPGFIDGHTHMDAQVMWDPLGTSSCWHGVTTVVMGNCGYTLAPARPDQRELVLRNLERAEDISRIAMAEGINWTWSSFPEYLDAVDSVPKGINYAGYVGHSALRTSAMGERAFTDAANDVDLDLMLRELTDALRAGAMGFTTSRSPLHETSDGRPVASRQASWAEVSKLVGAMGEFGRGIFEIAPRHETDNPESLMDDLWHISDLAAVSGVPATFGVHGRDSYEMLKVIDATILKGGKMFGQSHCRGINGVLSFKTRLPFDVLPVWSEVRGLPLDEQRRALCDPELRSRLVFAADRGNYGRSKAANPRRPDYETLRILNSPLPPHPSVASVASERGLHPVELMIDLGIESNFDQFFIQPLVPQDDDTAVTVMKHPHTVMTFSDSGAHVSQIMDASIHTYLLAYWVRERQLFTIEEAVRMLTSVPAKLWGFRDRGKLKAGFIGDVNILDPESVAPRLPRVVNDLPGKAIRLEQKSKGFLATVVGGTTFLRDGAPTGALNGRLLRAGR